MALLAADLHSGLELDMAAAAGKSLAAAVLGIAVAVAVVGSAADMNPFAAEIPFQCGYSRRRCTVAGFAGLEVSLVADDA